MNNCEFQNCKDPNFQNGHPKLCRFFKRQKCKFKENFAFKHEYNGKILDGKVFDEEVSKSRNTIKDLENVIENLKKELEMKEFI